MAKSQITAGLRRDGAREEGGDPLCAVPCQTAEEGLLVSPPRGKWAVTSPAD